MRERRVADLVTSQVLCSLLACHRVDEVTVAIGVSEQESKTERTTRVQNSEEHLAVVAIVVHGC